MANAALADPEALKRVADLSRPVTLARDQVLPVSVGFQGLLPEGGLRRGSTVAVGGPVGATSLALGLVAEASRTGSWTAVVAMPWLGLVAASEYGIDLTKVAIIDEPGDQWATVVACLVGAFDVVLTAQPSKVKSSDGRRLAARMRERGTVLVKVDSQSELGSRGKHITGDVTLTTARCEWGGLEAGHGRLTSRRVEVTVGGRGAASRGGSNWMWLPHVSGDVDETIVTREVTISPDRLIGSAEDVTERLRHLRAVPDVAG